MEPNQLIQPAPIQLPQTSNQNGSGQTQNKFYKSPPLLITGVAIVLIMGMLIYYFISQKGSPTVSRPQQPKSNIVFAEKLLNSYPTTEADLKAQNTPFTCPLPSSFCKTAANFKESSMSANIPANTKILAVFDGTAEGLNSSHPVPGGKDEEFKLIILTNNKLGLMVTYYLNGTTVTRQEIKAGEQIGISSGVPISFMGNKSFILDLIKNSAGGGRLEKLSPANFK
ncbi:hypothetical protein A2617_01000 [Candidatus Daviesbacteria bacterium RIFOXYD1_FULL_41_10]|uniref:Uncharacterized protein n=1 Tax=Candidatus Daviesbacteria bacterium RIFOXYD1_FULL_41_10 TaxID=1797801 RepID=A0A1F5MZ08_9BACT|nr:MAG: hypothetical protein A2617_01000 [Candidatus Daviesbacteria bacterium RIFOXYD1_FULL_41_10]